MYSSCGNEPGRRLPACVASVGISSSSWQPRAVVYGWSANLEYLPKLASPDGRSICRRGRHPASIRINHCLGLLHRMLSARSHLSPTTMAIAKLFSKRITSLRLRCVDVVQGIIIGLHRDVIRSRQGTLLPSVVWGTPRSGFAILAEASVVVLGMLLFCERTWKHHCVTLLLPFSVIAFCLGTPLFSVRVRWCLGVTIALAALLMLCDGDWTRRSTRPRRQVGPSLRRSVWAFLLLLVAMLIVLRQCHIEDAADRDGRFSARLTDCCGDAYAKRPQGRSHLGAFGFTCSRGRHCRLIQLADRLDARIDQVLRPAVRVEDADFVRVQAEVVVERGEDFLELDRPPGRGARRCGWSRRSPGRSSCRRRPAGRSTAAASGRGWRSC